MFADGLQEEWARLEQTLNVSNELLIGYKHHDMITLLDPAITVSNDHFITPHNCPDGGTRWQLDLFYGATHYF